MAGVHDGKIQLDGVRVLPNYHGRLRMRQRLESTGIRRALRSTVAVLASACTLGSIDFATAIELHYGADYLGEYSNNVRLTPSDEQADWINTAEIHLEMADSPESFAAAGRRLLSVSSRGLDLTRSSGYIDEARTRLSSRAAPRGFGLERTKDIEALVSARMTYEHYVNGSFDDQLLFGVDAFSTLMIRPRWFSWTVEDRFGQAPVSRLAATTADNRQDFNVFSTGPNFAFRFAPQHTVELEARYGRDMFQASPVDSQRYSGALRWVYAGSPSTLFSLNTQGERVDFESADNDFDRLDIFVGLATRRSRSEFLVNVGWSQIYRDRGALSEPIGRLEWSYLLTSGSRMGALLFAEHRDTAEDLVSITADTPRDTVGFTEPAVVADNIFTKHAEIFYEYARPFVGGRVSILADDRDYSASDELNERAYGGLLEIGYRPATLWEARLAAGYTFRDLPNARRADMGLGRTDNDSEISLRLLYRVQRHLTVSLRAAWLDRASTDPSVEFTEIVGGLALSYER
jgi:hypothetical protein